MKLLMDVHVSRAVAAALLRRCPGMSVAHLADWHQGQWREGADHDILLAARLEQRTFVTYDLKTIVPLLRWFAEEELDHAGVILVDDKTIPQWDVGRLTNALAKLWQAENKRPWVNRVHFLQKLEG